MYVVNIQPETECQRFYRHQLRVYCKLPMTEVEGCMFTMIQLLQHDTYNIAVRMCFS